MHRAIQFNKVLEKTLGVVVLFSVLASVGRYCSAMHKFNSVGSETSAVPPEQVLAKYDGNPLTAQSVQPYAELLNALEAKCTENRLQVAGIAATLTKKQRSAGDTLTYREGLETFLYEVAGPAAEQSETSCMNAYLDYADSNFN